MPDRSSQALAPKNILVAADFTPASERAAQYAAGLASKHHSKLTLLHVVNPKELEHQTGSRIAVLQGWKRTSQALLGPASRCALYASHGARPRPVSDCCCRRRKLEADLLVVGVRPAVPVLSRFMWPNAYEIVRESPCPVLTVRERH